MKLVCKMCSEQYEKTTGHYNRAVKLGANLYCSKSCSNEARRLHKSEEQIKSEKSEYDKARIRGPKRDEILESKRQYHYDNKEVINAKQRVYNKKRMPSHVIYCRQPDQREKERLRNRKKNGLTELKKCISCNQDKQKIEFESYLVFPDKRNYLCRDCDHSQHKEFGINTKQVLQNIRSNLIKTNSKLKIQDITKYPYLIEANKYLLLLKRLTK